MGKGRKKKASRSSSKAEAPKISSSNPVVFEVWVKAGGRCEFRGCNADLLQDALTKHDARIANIAHIVSRSRYGPRGDDPLPFDERNEIHNLMLACPKDHLLIDNKKLVGQFPKELLLQYKREHEDRIQFLTTIGPDRETVVVRVVGNIRGDSVSISKEEVRKAVLEWDGRYPHFLGAENAIEIDLTNFPKEAGEAYWESAKSKIDEQVDQRIIPAIDNRSIKHVSIFALCRIPLLIYLGYRLGDKIPLQIYQKQRVKGDGWGWEEDMNEINFRSELLQQGKDPANVAVLLSLSGNISTVDLPEDINGAFSIYELSPRNSAPNRELMRSHSTLVAFRREYQMLLRRIERDHKPLKEIHLFPALPISAAVTCGREILKDVTPSLLVYDKMESTFRLTLRVN
jgi:hypothetical protein